MPFELGDFPHFRVLPDAKLVVDIAVRGENLLVMRIPQERADLTVCADLVNHLTGVCVPELDRFVPTAATRGKKISFPRTPGQSFHRSLVLSKNCAGTVHRHVFEGICILRERVVAGKAATHALVQVPNAELVVVPSTSELGAVRTPFEPANFLLMTFKSTNKTVSHSDIVMKNLGVERPTAEHIWSVPSQRAHPPIVLARTFECPHALLCFHIPQLDLLVRSADGRLRFIDLIRIKSLRACVGLPGD